MQPEQPQAFTQRARKDVLRIGLAVLVIVVMVSVDPDQFFEWLARHREVQLDEFLVAVIILGVGFALFSWRRWIDLSRQVAEYKRLQKELNAINQEASQLNETDDLLQSCLSSDEAYQIVIRHLRSQLPASSGAVCTFTPGREFVETVAHWGAPALSDRLFHSKDCWALRRGRVQTLRADDPKPICEHIGPARPSYAMCVPMVAQGETLGILYLEGGSGEQERSASLLQPLSESQGRTVKILAEHLALAVANLNLRENLRMQSIRDPLTDLFNRRYMEESFDRELWRSIRRETPLAVIMADIDHFKQYNDSFGHEAGDAVLQELGRVFRTHLRAEDIACRYGGEEFVLILPEAPLASAIDRAEQLCRTVRVTEVRFRGVALPRISVSVGLACHPEHGSTRESLLRSADAALYKAKEQGRDRVIVASVSPRHGGP
jgi:diguanylate cyclase (GGDEF)-like protein